MSPLRDRAGRWGATADWIITALDGDLASLSVYTLLVARYADRHGGGWFPTVAQIASDLRVSERTVNNSLSRLRGLGLLRTWRGRAATPGNSPLQMMLDDTMPRGVDATTAHHAEGGGRNHGTSQPNDTFYRIQRSDPDPDGRTVGATRRQRGFFDEVERERGQVLTDLIAEAFNGRKGSRSTRDRLARLVRAGATARQMANAIAITKAEPRDDPVRYAVAVLARFVEEGVDGDADVQRLTENRARPATVRRQQGATQPRGLAGHRARSGAALDEYGDAF